MSDATLSPTPSAAQERNLQLALVSGTVPFKEGGGLVFPLGLFSGGYRLDEWQFERYRASLAREAAGDKTRQRWRLAIALMILLILLCLGLAAIVVLQFMAVDLGAFFTDESLPWLLLLLGLTLALLVAVIFRPVLRRRARLLADFPDAPRVPRATQFRRRVIGLLACSPHLPSLSLASAVLWAAASLASFLSTGLYLLIGGHGELAAIWAATGVLMLLSAVIHGYLYAVYRQFRRQHGRAPTPKDLKPV